MQISRPWQKPLIGAILGVTIAVAATGRAQAQETVPAYRAVYDAYYQGRRIGETEFSVLRTASAPDTYEFRSVSRLAGLLRIFAPRPPEELSRFIVENGKIRPLSYSLGDGTARGRNSYRVDFDWGLGLAVTTADGVTVETELVPGVLDPGSMRAHLMLHSVPDDSEQVTLLDRDELEIHELRARGEQTIETPFGTFSTRQLIQNRLGSSRRTLIWLALDLNNLPVRIERQREGETRLALHLKSVTWLD